MGKIRNLFSDSFKEITVTGNLVLCGLMAALAVVLNYTTSIFITPSIRIGFSGIPNRVVEFLFGPGVGAVFGGMLDILKYILKPEGGAFFPGFTLSAIAAGLIYGTVLYKKPLKIWRVFVAELLVKIFVNCGMNTVWTSILIKKGVLALLFPRVIKNIIMLPIDTIIIFMILTVTTRIMSEAEFKKFSKAGGKDD